MPRRIRITLAYDGTEFHGWQIQPGLPTVQGTLSGAIHHAIGERVLPQGSGRTDAGVHALGQVASFSLEAPIPPARLQYTLNRCLPSSIRILSAELAPPTFHARHSALSKTYEYRIFPLRPSTETEGPHLASEMSVQDSICPPFLAPYVWPCPWPIQLDALNQAARHVLGTHDFTSFAASDPDFAASVSAVADPPQHLADAWDPERAALARSTVRAITHSCWHAADGPFIYRVTANGFLHHMVRNLVGTFVQAGAHRIDPDSIPELLAACNRSVAGPTAPPTGLFLVSVDYPPLNLEPSA